jgi:hypothetical protein
VASSSNTKVVLVQSVLRGSNISTLLQEVATVHINEREFRVCAPPTATGKAVEWLPHFSVRRQGGYFAEEEQGDEYKAWALRLVKEALENEARDKSRADGTHPDGIHCSAQICRKGDIQHCDGLFRANPRFPAISRHEKLCSSSVLSWVRKAVPVDGGPPTNRSAPA